MNFPYNIDINIDNGHIKLNKGEQLRKYIKGNQIKTRSQQPNSYVSVQTKYYPIGINIYIS